MPATYSKLRNGSWGVRVVGDAQQGQPVTVTLRNGTTKQETLGALVATYHDNGATARVFTIVPRAREARPVEAIGDLTGIMGLFNRARNHLRFPAIVLSVPAIGETIRVNVAGFRAQFPGSINVASKERVAANGRKVWYGRIHQDGRFEQSHQNSESITERLRAFAANPAAVAAEHGRLTGTCCFCNHPLRDERSTAVGYGPDCAAHYGLAWGSRPAEFAAPVAPAPAPVARRINPAPAFSCTDVTD